MKASLSISLCLLLLSACGPAANAPVKTGSNTPASSAPASAAPASATPVVVQSAVTSFAFVSIDADKVTTSDSVKPDGTKDGHFKTTLTLADQTEIKSVRIQGLNADGTLSGQVWNTNDTNFFNLAVVDSTGKTINLEKGYPQTLGKFATGSSHQLSFDLYASDTGFFNSDNEFKLEITLGDGSKITKTAKAKG